MTDATIRATASRLEARIRDLELRIQRAASGPADTAGIIYVITSTVPGLITTAIRPTPWTGLAHGGSGWGNVPTYLMGGWSRDASGWIHLRGTLRFTPGVLVTTIATLPVGARPTAIAQFPCRGGDGSATYVHVRPTGVIEFGGTLLAAQASATLDGISFDTR